MNLQKMNWYEKEDDFKSRNTLGKITWIEMYISDLSVSLEELKQKYISEISPFKKSDRVYWKYASKDFRCGIIKNVSFDVHYGFTVTIERMNQGFKKTQKRTPLIRIDLENLGVGQTDIKKA